MKKQKQDRNWIVIILTAILCLSVLMNIFQVVQVNIIRNGESKQLEEQAEKLKWYDDNYSPIYEYLSSLKHDDLMNEIATMEPVIVYFGRPNCDDCTSFEPMFIELIKQYNLQDKIYYMNVKWEQEKDKKEWEDFKAWYGFSQTPAFVKYEGGGKVSAIEWTDKGLPKSDLEKWLQENGVI